MSSVTQSRLERQVAQAAERAVAERQYVTAIDILAGMGWLTPVQVEEWRRGRVPYLERVVRANLHKLSAAMQMFRRWADQRGLRPSETVYVSWTRDRHPLRFSKTGDPAIERAYCTHWVSPALQEAKHQRQTAQTDDQHTRHDDAQVPQPDFPGAGRQRIPASSESQHLDRQRQSGTQRGDHSGRG